MAALMGLPAANSSGLRSRLDGLESIRPVAGDDAPASHLWVRRRKQWVVGRPDGAQRWAVGCRPGLRVGGNFGSSHLLVQLAALEASSEFHPW